MSAAIVAEAPRPRTATWQEGDALTLGRTRWIIRVLRGEHVELEAANVPAGIWWTTTLDKLPEKVAP